ncbi:MAG TPA: aldo/keto reductase [Acidimicrobiales bacterium]|nr:aldo/keto reductase [Acidimicrobiales bacterium]
MRYVNAGGARLSVIGVGTWQFGSREWGYGEQYASAESQRIVHRALDLGVNLFDTAEAYGFGRSERILGRALEGRRSSAFVATKVFPVLPLAPIVAQRGRASRGRLGVDAIDLYQLHWPNPVVPLREQMAGMRRLLDGGVVHHVGVSNYRLEGWMAADRALGAPVLSNQVRFSLADTRPLAMAEWAAAQGRVVIAYSPLAQGLLSARYDETNAPGGVRATNPLFLPESLRRARPLLDTLREVAAAHDAKPSQVALAWVVHHPNVVAIPGASSVEQLEQNVAAADITLSPGEMEALTGAALAFSPVSGPAAWTGVLRRRVGR